MPHAMAIRYAICHPRRLTMSSPGISLVIRLMAATCRRPIAGICVPQSDSRHELFASPGKGRMAGRGWKNKSYDIGIKTCQACATAFAVCAAVPAAAILSPWFARVLT